MRILEISCPLCREKIRSEAAKTWKQWKYSLIFHLMTAPRHRLPIEEAEDVAKSYVLMELATPILVS